jgi:glutamate N-acetyltransferase/amino-acid N-acetyltransferase
MTDNFLMNNVCAPQGFIASGVCCGIKKSGKLDLGLIYSKVPAAAAGVYTKNRIKAAPLLVTQQNINQGQLQAIITNSGNANACTGEQGLQDAHLTIHTLASELNIPAELIAVSSTGVIGVPLPVTKIVNSIPQLVTKLSSDGAQSTAKAILTTDTFIKQSVETITLSDGTLVTLGGIAKGSGMIHPNMATMLAYITSDIAISTEALQQALTKAVNYSFNMISVDGDSSTNDMAIIMANGCANNQLITDLNSLDGQLFYQSLEKICIRLARLIASDGEGASKLITVNVVGGLSEQQAQNVAKGVISSSLVKAAVFGKDANWGRIACAAGYSDDLVEADKMQIKLADLLLFKNGLPLPFCEQQALTILENQEVIINLDLGLGDHQATAWGCDLTYDYVKINAAYRT